jgi:hypothetical protein
MRQESLSSALLLQAQSFAPKRMDVVLKDEDETAILYRSHLVRLQAHTSLYVSEAGEAGMEGQRPGCRLELSAPCHSWQVLANLSLSRIPKGGLRPYQKWHI